MRSQFMKLWTMPCSRRPVSSTPGATQAGRVGLALVTERIVFAGDHDSSGQASEVGRVEGADARIGSHGWVGHPLGAEPVDVFGLQAEAMALTAHRRAGVGEIRVGVDQGLHRGARLGRFVPGPQTRQGGNGAASR
jgi:hypothetical protein